MRRARLDQAAMVLSGVCMVHCIASVAGLFAIGLLASFGAVDEIFHRAMLALIVPVSVLAIVAGYCLLYTSPSPRDKRQSRMPSSA